MNKLEQKIKDKIDEIINQIHETTNESIYWMNSLEEAEEKNSNLKSSYENMFINTNRKLNKLHEIHDVLVSLLKD